MTEGRTRYERTQVGRSAVPWYRRRMALVPTPRSALVLALVACFTAGVGCRSCEKHGQSGAGERGTPLPAASSPSPGQEPAGLRARIEGTIEAIQPEPHGDATGTVRLTVRPSNLAAVEVEHAPALAWAKGDSVFVSGPWIARGDGAAIDCSRPWDCAIGLAYGGDIQIRGLDLHHAGRFYSHLFGVDVIVVGGSTAPLFFDIRAADAEGASRALAAAAGVSTRAVDAVRLFGPGDRLSAAEGAPLPLRCYPMSRDGYQVPGDEIVPQLVDKLRCRPMVRGVLEGRATLDLHRKDTATVLGLLLRLANARWNEGNDALTIVDVAAFPDIVPVQPALYGTTAPGPWKDKIRAFPIDALAVAAITVRQGAPTVAVVQPRTDQGYGWAAVVDTGDELITSDDVRTEDGGASSTQWQVKTIERDKVTLRRETGVARDKSISLASRPASPPWWLARPPTATVAMLTTEGCPPGMAVVGAGCFDVAEVTVRDYERCVAARACEASASGGLCNAGRSGVAEHPINCITWDQAAGYCKWAGKRLPTEAEWAEVVRVPPPWGTGEPGNDFVCWRRGRVGTCAVGRTRPEAYGLRGLAGNVSEWIEGGEGESHSIRGGHFGGAKQADFYAQGAGEGGATLGVRCAKSR